MKLDALKPPEGSQHREKRVGRGRSSGHGKTSGRGQKGQRSRSGSRRWPGFQGGQMMLYRRLPKRGMSRGGKANMTTHTKMHFAVVNIEKLNIFDSESVVGPHELIERGLVRGMSRPVKILANGKLTRSLTVKAHAFSAKAAEAIHQAGGTTEVLPLIMERGRIGTAEQEAC